MKITLLFSSDFPEDWNILANDFRSLSNLLATCDSFQRIDKNEHISTNQVHHEIKSRLTLFFAAASSRLIPPAGYPSKLIRYTSIARKRIDNEE
jgi:hypothetical protein